MERKGHTVLWGQMSQLAALCLVAIALSCPVHGVVDEGDAVPHKDADRLTPACDSRYNAWMQELHARYRQMRAAAASMSTEALDAAEHPDNAPQDFNDVLDLRLDDEDVLEATFGSDTKSDDEFYHEHVSGGRIVREDLMVLHLRARRRKAMEHQHQVHHDRLDVQRSYAQKESARLKVLRPLRSLWQQWVGWTMRNVGYLVDLLAFVVLVVVPWRMLLEMRDWDRVGSTMRGRRRR